MRCVECVFSTAGVSRLARTLYIALRDRAIKVPDDEELVRELQSVRLVEVGAGVKMQNPPGTHDDLVVACAMVAVDLLDRPQPGGRVMRPTGTISDGLRRIPRTAQTARRLGHSGAPSRPSEAPDAALANFRRTLGKG